ncbi:hypothetical protein [Psychromonas sp. SP041]|uniref:hypothetical protein n=1 Tax=Psychromonas sp. SP041 TaxID=1365007 RepID=UPI000472EC43|nr:hypothetical protein [Psychromonas sp. SP041]
MIASKSFNGLRELFVNYGKTKIMEMDLPDSCTLVVGTGSVSLHLHNAGDMKPTVYSVSSCQNIMVATLDTVVHGNKEHEHIKTTLYVDDAFIKLKKLASQIHSGNKENTHKHFSYLNETYTKLDI